jgi:RHS repeat-associated protein
MKMKNVCWSKVSSSLGAVVFLIAIASANISWAAQSNGSNNVFALSQNLDVDPSSGTASISIPIEVPQGRAGIQPNVTLLYNSSGSNGMLGVGWSMELGSIQRSMKKGMPKYNNADMFVLVQAGSSQELVDISGNGTEFRLETEGSFSKIKFDGSSWIITDRKGTKYYFGTSATARVADPASASKVFKWCLEQVEDISGNYLTISYMAADNQLYPQEIKYTGNTTANLLPYASVNFSYDVKANVADTTNSFATGFKILQTKRLSTIEVRAEGNLIKKYVLNYLQAPVTGKSLLNNVTLVGTDGFSTLPATKMTYSQPSYTLNPSVNITTLPGNLSDSRYRMIDMNNDGLSDFLDTSIAGNWKVYLNTFHNAMISFGAAVALSNSPAFTGDNTNSLFVDLNGDGLLDAILGDSVGSYRVWINNGNNGFEAVKYVANTPASTLSSKTIQFLDMNNDGVMDMVESFASENKPYKIYINDGNGNFAVGISAVNSPYQSFTNGNIQMADFNGDGLLDVILASFTSPYKVWLNNGVNGYEQVKTTTSYPLALDFLSQRIQLADINGDGLSDLLVTGASYTLYISNGRGDFNIAVTMYSTPGVGVNDPAVKLIDANGDHLPDVVVGKAPYKFYLNNGNGGFLSPVVLSNYPSVNLDDSSIVMADIDGDQVLDFMYGNTSGNRFWSNSLNERQARANSLIDVDNSFGGHLELQYQNLPIKGWGGLQYGFANSRILLNTVKTISRRASLTGDVYVAKYDYLEGLWDNKNREFRGFKTVKMIDPDGNYSLTEYAQDDIYKGRPLSQASYDSAGKLYSKSENIWAYQELGDGVVFPYLKQEDSYIYDGNATGRRTQAQYFYEENPQYGNLTKSINFGEVDLTTGTDIGTDKNTSYVQYHNNTNAWLLGLPKISIATDNAGAQFAKTTFFYDSSTNFLTLPTKGLMTKKVDWAGTAPYAVDPYVNYSYDDIGNLVMMQDISGSKTMITYDAIYKIFPLETSNAAAHKVVNEYYGVNGVALSGSDGTLGLWGQLKSTTDPNEKKGLRIYDVFGRTIKTVSPLDTIALPTMSYEYVYGVSQLKVIAKQRIKSGSAGTIDTVQFLDGLGRVVQSKSKSEKPGQFIVSGLSEYNSRGLPVKKYVPYMTSVPLSELDVLDTNQPYTLISYDAMGRAVRTTAPDGSYSNVIYDDWDSTSFDENGHMQKSYADFAGRLIKKEEYTGADGRNHVYPASAFTLYATTLYTYDAKGNLTKTQDAKGNVTTIDYNTFGRKTQMTDPDMGTWKYQYDYVGNLTRQDDAKGQSLRFGYDQLNRLTAKTDLNLIRVNYTYDQVNSINGKGRLNNAKYYNGASYFSYDNLGREKQSVKAIGENYYDVSRTYDALDRLVTLQYPENSTVGYTYNEAGQVNSVFSMLPTTTIPDSSGDDAFYMASPFAQYRFNENAASIAVFDSGTSKTNIASASNTSTLSNNGKVGKGFRFNGVNNFVNTDALFSKVRYDNKGSFSFWLKPETGSSLITFGGPGGYFSIDWSEFTQAVSVSISGAGTPISCVTPNNSVPVGNWVHVVVVQDAVDLKIYINGQEQPLFYWYQNNKAAWLNYTWAGPMNYGRIGAFNATANPASNSSFFKGTLDDIRYYSNKALIPQEVWGIYNKGLGTEAENPSVSNTPPPNVSLVARVISPFAHYKLNDNAPSVDVLDEAVGYNDGVATNYTSALSVSGKINGALNFNGVDQYVDMSSLWSDIRYDSVGAFSMWVKPVAGFPILNFAGTGGFFLIAYNSNQSLEFGITGSGNPISCVTQAGSVPANVFSHVVVTQDGTQLKIYINGILQQNLTYTYQSNKAAWVNFLSGPITNARLGSSAIYGGNKSYFKGSVDDVRYYRKALNVDEIKALYNEGAGTEEENPAMGTVPVVLPPLEPSTVPQSAGQVYIKNVDYNATGQMTKVEFGNGVVTTYGYSPTMLRLTNLTTVNASGTVLQDLSYAYDGVGNITQIIDAVNTASQTFKYDALNRLTQSTGVAYGTKTYTYDQIGNITSKDGLTYTYGENGAGPHAVTSLSDGTTMTYDANGNMSTKSKSGVVMQYYYDSENRLAEVRKNMTLIAQYMYDGDGGRVQKTSYVTTANSVSSGLSYGALLGDPQITSTPVITKYVGEMYEETDNVGTRFIFLGGQRIAAVDTVSGSPVFYHGDHLGSTNVMTDNNGNQIELLEYDPYGKINRHDATSGSSRLAKQQFTGKKLDDETGLIYFGARYYDPSLGRFITPDTIVQNPSDPQTLNRYSYCGNNPVNRVDLDGHKWSWKKFFINFAAAVVGVTVAVVSAGTLAPAVGAFWAAVAGGAIGGAISGGMATGLQGGSWSQIGMSVLMGAGFGAIGGGIAGSSLSNLAKGIIAGIGILGGGAYAAATDNLDSFTGGLVGAVGGGIVGKRILNSINSKSSSNNNLLKQERKGAQNLKTDQKPGPTYKIKTNYDIEGQIKSFDFGPDGDNTANIKVIGRLPDTAVAKSWPGHDVLDLPKSQWSELKNDAWIKSGINNKQTFYTASPQTFENVTGTIYGREIIIIEGSNKYIQVEQYYIPK